jgi:hypothetical protein
LHAKGRQGFADVIELEGFDDGHDQLHPHLSIPTVSSHVPRAPVVARRVGG